MKKLLLVVNTSSYNIRNRKSAIDSILCSMLDNLNSYYSISVNGIPFENSKESLNEPIYNLSNTRKIKKYIPAVIKRNYNDFLAIKSNRDIFKEIISAEKPDVIIELMRYGSRLGIMVKEYYDVPLIAYFDAATVEERKFFYKGQSLFDFIAKKNESETIKKANQIIIYTQPVVDYWKARLVGINEKKFNIFQTLDYSRLDFVENKKFNQIPIIGFVGSFLKWHRIDMLVEAFEMIKKEGIEAKLLLVGAGEEFLAISNQVRNSKYEKDITLTGFVDGDALKNHRNSIDIGVMSGTHWYCMPTKVFEYGAAAIPTIAPRTKNIQFLFKENEEIVLFEQNNINDLYLSLKKVIQNFSEFRNTGDKLQIAVKERNSREKAITFYTNLISKTLTSKQ